MSESCELSGIFAAIIVIFSFFISINAVERAVLNVKISERAVLPSRPVMRIVKK